MMNDPDMIASCNEVERQWIESGKKLQADVAGITRDLDNGDFPYAQANRILEDTNFVQLSELREFCMPVYLKQSEP